MEVSESNWKVRLIKFSFATSSGLPLTVCDLYLYTFLAILVLPVSILAYLFTNGKESDCGLGCQLLLTCFITGFLASVLFNFVFELGAYLTGGKNFFLFLCYSTSFGFVTVYIIYHCKVVIEYINKKRKNCERITYK